MSTPPHQPTVRTGPSRDMFGGPWLGIIVFLMIAVALGWVLTKLFEGMVDQTQQSLSAEAFDHGFDSTKPYTLKRDLVLGIRTGRDIALVPFKDDLPRDTPGRYTWPTVEQYKEDPEGHESSHGLIGVVEAGTQVQFVEVIDDADNAQTRILVMTRVLTGPYARKTPVVGMHLESADSNQQAGTTRYEPRNDLFEIVETSDGSVQSPDPAPNDE